MVLRAENGYTRYTIHPRTKIGLAAAHTVSGNHIYVSLLFTNTYLVGSQCSLSV